MTTQTEKYTAPALDKGLDILEILAEADAGLTQAEIARQLGRSVGEIFRMLVVLRRRGLVVLNERSDLYTMTTGLFELANRTPVVRRLSVASGAILRDLAQTVRQSVHVAVLSGDSIVVVSQVDNPGDNVLAVRIGARIETWRTSSGRVILAFQPQSTIDRYVRDFPHPDGRSPSDVARDLEEIRSTRSETMPSFVIKGVTNISAPIVAHDGFAAAAMTIPMIGRYFGGVSLERCREELLASANRLSREIGGNFNR
jgi:DNA-binding IclR family transcriptional regulator